jgi:hypothetical protein
MYTINQGINGGWSGSVVAATPEGALAEARELARVVAQLRLEHPRAQRTEAEAAPDAPELSAKGEACLAYCQANPKSTHAEYTAAGHTLRTVKWLREHGYLSDVNGLWVVTRPT